MTHYELITSDVTKWATDYKGPKFHAMLSDFPYDLGFMGKEWDTNAQFEEWGRALLPTLLPGAPAFVFGGNRTWHRLAVGMENAGFRIWDTLMYCFGTGMPKGQATTRLLKKQDKNDVAEFWTGYQTLAMKPAWEPILCLQAPAGKLTYAELAAQFGTGSLNIDGARVPTTEQDRKAFERLKGFRNTRSIGGTSAYSGGKVTDRSTYDGNKGRYPSNLILDPEAAEVLEAEAGVSRFFWTTKVRKGERNQGLPEGVQNLHPTLKSVSLATHLATLLLPPPEVGTRRIVVPFSGSGSEVIGCMLAGWDEIIGVELDPEYNEIAGHRCESAARGEYYKFVK